MALLKGRDVNTKDIGKIMKIRQLTRDNGKNSKIRINNGGYDFFKLL